MLTVSVRNAPAELRAAVLAMKRADSVVRRDVSARMRESMNPAWRAEVTERTPAGLAGRLLNVGVRITGGNPPQLVAASSRRKVGNGGTLTPDTNWPGWEYGASGDDEKTYTTRSRAGTAYKVTRHTERQMPARRRNGRVLGPAVQAILPRVAAYWTQSVIRAFMDAAEGKDS